MIWTRLIGFAAATIAIAALNEACGGDDRRRSPGDGGDTGLTPDNYLSICGSIASQISRYLGCGVAIHRDSDTIAGMTTASTHTPDDETAFQSALDSGLCLIDCRWSAFSEIDGVSSCDVLLTIPYTADLSQEAGGSIIDVAPGIVVENQTPVTSYSGEIPEKCEVIDTGEVEPLEEPEEGEVT